MASPDIRILDLRCEYLVAPLGIDERAPRLSWRIDSTRRGARQVAYRVRVASSAQALADGHADRWDSGRVESDRTNQIEYAGTPLRSRDRCHWDVEIWDETGTSARSAPSLWTMGLLEPSDWTARWITHDPAIIERDPDARHGTLTDPGTPALFRREFDVPAPVVRATLHASARGVFELKANGRRVGADLFAPEWTDYDKRIHYRTYDVTDLITRGANCLAATLGDGWWSGFVGWQETRGRYGSLENSLLVQLEVELANGERLTIGTDRTWACNTGPILSSDFQMGEVYDARRVRPGWDCPGISNRKSELESRRSDPSEIADSGFDSPPPDPRSSISALPWLPAREAPPPAAALVAQRSEPVRAIETIEPRDVRQVDAATFIYDLGQNITGRVRLHLRGVPAGTRVTLRHAERLKPDGTLYTENLRRAKATDVFIASGATEETYEPSFTFHGFQYVEVSTDRPITPWGRITVSGVIIHSATPPAGSFACSHAGVNRLWENALWSQRDNFLSVPTDCPQRDERLGWTGDAQVFLRTATYNMDVAAFFTKWMIDVEDAQTPDGIFPDTAPRLREDIRWTGLDDLGGAAGWADAGIIVPWTIWRVYGDRRIIERHWGAMVAWLDYIERTNPDGLRIRELHNNYGDWLCLPTDTSFRTNSPMKNLLATAFWADDAAKMAVMARTLGRDADARRFAAMAARVRASWQREFLREDGRLTVETQTAYVLALAFDLLPEDVRARAAERLVDLIRANDWHLNTGFIGISHLNPTLTLAGHANVAYRLLLQETYPSWLYPVRHGATTIWERWNGWTEEDGFFEHGMNSFNHYSLGSVGEWLFRHVAGIELDPDEPGFQRFVLRPFVGAGLDFVRATYRSMHGTIESHWRRQDERLEWEIRVPANTQARVFIPSEPDTLVETDGLALVGREAGWAIVEAAAGHYILRSELAQ